MTEINPKTPMEELTIGGNIYCAGNAREFKTGDWRSNLDKRKMQTMWIMFPCMPRQFNSGRKRFKQRRI
mgnify:CR=1 FL=1